MWWWVRAYKNAVFAGILDFKSSFALALCLLLLDTLVRLSSRLISSPISLSRPANLSPSSRFSAGQDLFFLHSFLPSPLLESTCLLGDQPSLTSFPDGEDLVPQSGRHLLPRHLCGNDLKHPKTFTSPHLFGHMCSNMYKMWTKSFHGRIAILESKSSWRSVDTPLKNQHFSFFPPIVHGKFWKKCKNAKTVHCPMLPVVGYRSPLWPRYHTIWFTEKSKNTEVKIYFNLKTYMLISAIFQNIYSSSSSSSSIFQLLFILLVLLRHPVRDLVHVRAHSLIKICSVERDLLLKSMP